MLTLAVAAVWLKALLDLSTAKARAIRCGEREVDLFFNYVKLVLWEENEGLLFLKDKRISESKLHGAVNCNLVALLARGSLRARG